MLFRKHHLVLDPVPATADGFVRDVTTYPDAAELLLAADVLVTDYSSLMVDFAVTGPAAVLFAYDLETYERRGPRHVRRPRGRGPGPGRPHDRRAGRRAARRRHPRRGSASAFAARFAPHEDGRAAARAADVLFGPENG